MSCSFVACLKLHPSCSDSELASGFTQQETIESDLDRVSDTNFEIRDEVDRVQLPREEVSVFSKGNPSALV